MTEEPELQGGTITLVAATTEPAAAEPAPPTAKRGRRDPAIPATSLTRDHVTRIVWAHSGVRLGPGAHETVNTAVATLMIGFFTCLVSNLRDRAASGQPFVVTANDIQEVLKS